MSPPGQQPRLSTRALVSVRIKLRSDWLVGENMAAIAVTLLTRCETSSGRHSTASCGSAGRGGRDGSSWPAAAASAAGGWRGVRVLAYAARGRPASSLSPPPPARTCRPQTPLPRSAPVTTNPDSLASIAVGFLSVCGSRALSGQLTTEESSTWATICAKEETECLGAAAPLDASGWYRWSDCRQPSRRVNSEDLIPVHGRGLSLAAPPRGSTRRFASEAT